MRVVMMKKRIMVMIMDPKQRIMRVVIGFTITIITITIQARTWMNSTEGYEYEEVIVLIHREKKLDEHSNLILVLQIDEFQSGNYWTITLLRTIKSILVQVTLRTLIIPICTGTGRK
ncbi:unnamed protein product [Rhizophagus irregularis]|uniref:Uncharacterized protein n=2 Tax=Rhizophagus irregularis TaxID=588596 RepID=A0A915YZJ3_9GLOM|nr:unnamed protein product [Rhizophagus irregularis]CAB5356524.1 unnamed protein product [Rhizophagus irregularis]